MEILRYMRTQRGGVVHSRAARAAALLACCALISLGGCGRRADRSTETADSAVLQAKARSDSAVIYTVPPPTDTSGRSTGASSVSLPNPATILAADSIAGLRLYRREGNCISCHNTRAEGVVRLGSNISDQEWMRGDGSLSFLYAIIRDGVADPGAARSPMPGKGEQLAKKEIFQLAAYIYTLSHAGVTVPDSASLPAGAPPIAKLPPDTAHQTLRSPNFRN